MALTTSDKGYAILRSFEGRSLKAYRDAVGVWTIGYGNTNFDAEVLGFTIKAGTTITATQAEELLKTTVKRRYEPAVNENMRTDHQPSFDAGVSFHYNTGAISRASWVKSFVAKNLPAVHSQIMLWNKADGRVLAGLTRRRNREWEMISRGDYGPEGRNQPVDLDTGKPVIDGKERPGPYPGMMMLGDEGPEVKDLQEKLRALGYDAVPLDGKYSKTVEVAVTDFQKRHPQLRDDGIFGPATKNAMQRELDAKDKLKSTGAGTVATTGGTVAVDQVLGGAFPWWVVVGIIATGMVIAGYIAWQYRDEIRAMLKGKFQ